MTMAVSSPDSSISYKPGRIPGLEGLRAVAAGGVILTHVAFQTGVDPATPVGSVLARFDFFVPVFFALSAFLLWRRHRTDRRLSTIRRYLINRAGRILPAYLVCVGAVILLLPEASRMSGEQIAANLTLTQVYWADGLAPGLTHLWSLSVEATFYLVLPLLALTVGRLPRRGLVVLGRRTPEREELRELTDDLVIVEVGWTASDGSDPKEPVYELAMSDAALTGFLSWLESLPPGVLWRDSDDE